MKVQAFQYRSDKGWNISEFPEIKQEKALILIFAAPKFKKDTTEIDKIINKYPKANIVGCSSAGEIFGTEVFDDSLSVSIAEFNTSSVHICHSNIKDFKNSFFLGESLAKNLMVHTGLKGIVVISDGLMINGSELSKGINSVVPKNIIVTGGLAGDGANFKETWVLADKKIESGVVALVGFYGDDIVFSHGSKGGWDIFGPERTVTKSEGNTLYSIDNEPALDLYEKYLGDKAAELPASALLFPLQIRDKNSDHTLVRTILSIDREKKSMTFAGDIPEGCMAQLMRANFDRLIDGANEAASLINLDRVATDSQVLSIAISCVGRRLVLGERIDEEVEATMDALPKNTIQVGFYSYGELSPFVKNQLCELHNQTMTLTAIGERKIG